MDIKFSVKVNKKRRYIVNGQEYDSLDAMPQDIRESFEKALAAREGAGPAGAAQERSEEERIAEAEARALAMAQGLARPSGAPKWLLAAAALAVLLVVLYLMTRG